MRRAGAADRARAIGRAANPAGAPAPADDTLFRALGGQAGIDRIVGDFVPRLVADPRTAEFFRKRNQAHLKAMLAQQFCVVSGGGCTYTGLPMKQAHQDIDVSKGDFNALVEVLQSSMERAGRAVRDAEPVAGAPGADASGCRQRALTGMGVPVRRGRAGHHHGHR